MSELHFNLQAELFYWFQLPTSLPPSLARPSPLGHSNLAEPQLTGWPCDPGENRATETDDGRDSQGETGCAAAGGRPALSNTSQSRPGKQSSEQNNSLEELRLHLKLLILLYYSNMIIQ